jgi:hypothetical protein
MSVALLLLPNLISLKEISFNLLMLSKSLKNAKEFSKKNSMKMTRENYSTLENSLVGKCQIIFAQHLVLITSNSINTESRQAMILLFKTK